MVVLPDFRFVSARNAKHRPRRGPAARAACLAACLIGIGLLSACAYRGGIEQPFRQKVAWFSYLNGDDIRAACVPGAPRQYRLVYNGEYDRQVRTYEVQAEGGGGRYTARVQGRGGIDPARLSLSGLAGLGGWTVARARLDGAAMAEFERVLTVSGAFAPAPDGLNLASEEFYWLFVGCRDAKVHFNAWRFPGARFAALRFPAVLLRHDATGVALNPPRDVGPIDRVKRGGEPENTTPRFDLAVGREGLKGVAPLF